MTNAATPTAVMTYSSVNEIGFDVLRDQLATTGTASVSPVPDVAIIDEADSVLVDEALIPLVLAGSTKGPGADQAIHEVVARLKSKHYEIRDRRAQCQRSPMRAPPSSRQSSAASTCTANSMSAPLWSTSSITPHAYYLLERDVRDIVRDGGVCTLINASRSPVSAAAALARRRAGRSGDREGSPRPIRAR